MSQKTPPTYTPPQPVLAMSGQDANSQGYTQAQQEYGPQMGAQAQGIADINQGAGYYNSFGPSTLSQAIGNQYFQNVWPQEQSMIQNQFANSGMNYSPAMASTMANAYGTLGTNVGEYEQGISNQNATNNLSDLLSINPMTYSQPLTNNIMNQSNINTQQQNAYNQAVAQQQYQQQYNKYAQSNALASTIGQISPIGGQTYGAFTGTSGSAFGGTAQSLSSPMNQLAMNNMMQQYSMQPGSYQAGSNGLGGGSSFGNAGQSISNGATSAYGTTGAESGAAQMSLAQGPQMSMAAFGA